MKKLALFSFFCMIVIFYSNESEAQTKNIHIAVTDEDGTPVLGATILIKGTSTSVVTDIDGEATITVTPTVTIQIRMLGYQTQEVIITGSTQTDYNIILLLDEDF